MTNLLPLMLLFLFVMSAAVGPIFAVFYLVYFLATVPFRRLERARLFLDLVQNGLNRGESPERTIVGLAQSRDRSLGARFHLLAAHIEGGLRLGQALDRVPRLLPPPMVEMLKAGEAIGDVGKVWPACRRLAGDGQSQMRGAFNYLVVLVLVMTPAVPVIYGVLNVFILPKYGVIMDEMLGMDSAAGTSSALMPWGWTIVCTQAVVSLLVYLVALVYVGGPRLTGRMQGVFGDWVARIPWWLPWRRGRMLRDFAGMLAVLLDGGMPEAQAVNLAAKATANALFMRRAECAGEKLRAGETLMEAVGQLDDSGGFRWRLGNAARGADGFRAALHGWLEALEARAFQQEQAASQLITTGVVMMNGVTVAVLGLAVFTPLRDLVTIMVLW